MANPRISLKRAAKLRDLSEKNVYARAHEGLIRTHPGRDRRTKAEVDLREFDQDVTALSCHGPGCEKPAKDAGRFCSHPCSVRKYPVELRVCRQCKETFELIGHRAKDGDDNFCGTSCSTAWRWEHEPESFPQSERRGRVVTCPAAAPPATSRHRRRAS